MTNIQKKIDDLKVELDSKLKSNEAVNVEYNEAVRAGKNRDELEKTRRRLYMDISGLEEEIEDLVRLRYYEKDVKDGGTGKALSDREEFTKLATSKIDMQILKDVDDLLELGKEVPYELDDDILTLFGTNRSLYEKLMADDRVSRLLKKNDYYIADAEELSIKLYYMNYYGTGSNKKYLSEYLAYNKKKVKRKDYVESVRELISYDDSEQFTEKEAIDMYKELIKWW